MKYKYLSGRLVLGVIFIVLSLASNAFVVKMPSVEYKVVSFH